MKIRQRGRDCDLDLPFSRRTSPSAAASALRLRGGQSAVAPEDGEVVQPCRAATHERIERGDRVGDSESRALRLAFRRSPPAGRRTQIDKSAAADRTLSRCVANDKAILLRRGDRPVEHKLNIR